MGPRLDEGSDDCRPSKPPAGQPSTEPPVCLPEAAPDIYGWKTEVGDVGGF